MARNLFEGKFTSKITSSYLKLGFNPHLFTYFSYALFFLVGKTSYTSVKLATIFYGTIILFPMYLMMRDWYGKKAALLAAFTLGFNPITLFFSSIPINGSEIIGLTFFFTTIYFLDKSIKEKSPKYSLIAGLFAFSTIATRAEYLYTLLLILPFWSFARTERNQAFNSFVKACLLIFPIFLLRKSDFITPPRSYVTSLLPLILLMLYTLIQSKYDRSNLSNLSLFNIVIAGLMALCMPKWYELVRTKRAFFLLGHVLIRTQR